MTQVQRWGGLGVAALAICLISGCGSTSKTDTTTSTNKSAVTTSSTQSAKAADLGPIETLSDVKVYTDHIDETFSGSCYVITESMGTQCAVDATFAAGWLGDLLERLPSDAPKTKNATQEAISSLKHWSQDCVNTEPNSDARRQCIPYIPRKSLTLDIVMAWYEDHP